MTEWNEQDEDPAWSCIGVLILLAAFALIGFGMALGAALW